MKRTAYWIALPALALTVLTACDDNAKPEPWVPGEVSDAQGIYFTNTDNILTITKEQMAPMTIPVSRIDNAGELTVPLVVTAADAEIHVPSAVTFRDGDYDSEIVVTVGDVPAKQLLALNITFPDEYVNPYALGPAVFDGSVLLSDWEEVSGSPVRFEWLDWDYLPTDLIDPVDQTVMTLPGTTRYRIIDFLHTGVDFTFDLQDSQYAGWKGYKRIMPMGNQVLYSEYSWSGYYNQWWLVTDDLQTWPEAYLSYKGNELLLYAMSFMWYDDEYGNEYCFMRLKGDEDEKGVKAPTTFGYFTCYGFYTEDWDWGNFTGYLHLYFELPDAEV